MREGTWILPGSSDGVAYRNNIKDWVTLMTFEPVKVGDDYMVYLDVETGPLLPRNDYEMKHNFLVWGYHV